MVRYREDLAAMHSRLGDLLRDTKPPNQAKAAIQKALVVSEQLAAELATLARWLGPDGTPQTDAFHISGWADNIGDSAALPGGPAGIVEPLR